MALRSKWNPVGKNGTIELTIWHNENPIEASTLNVSKPRTRQECINRIKEKFPKVDAAALEQELIKIAAELQEANRRTTPEDDPDSEELLKKMPKPVKAEARRILESPDLVKMIVDDIGQLGVAGEKETATTVYLTGTSRLLSRPLANIVQGLSSSGKSWLIEGVARMFPPEAVVIAHQMTPQALFHMKPGSLRHRFVVAGERSRKENDDTAEATRALREMISSGRLVKLMPMKEDGGIVTVEIVQEGPIAFVESTTLTQIFDEDLNRCILLGTDERPEQTRNVLHSIARSRSGQAVDTARIIERHHAIQRMLKRRPVQIPYAVPLAELFPQKRVEARRAFGHLLNMIEASALLHQFQRPVDDGRLVATEDDYKLARHLLAKPLGRSLGGQLGDSVARFHERLTTWAEESFTAQDAISYEKQHGTVGSRSVYGYLKDLADNGLAKIIEEKRGPIPARWELIEADATATAAVLPTLEKLFNVEG